MAALKSNRIHQDTQARQPESNTPSSVVVATAAVTSNLRLVDVVTNAHEAVPVAIVGHLKAGLAVVPLVRIGQSLIHQPADIA